MQTASIPALPNEKSLNALSMAAVSATKTETGSNLTHAKHQRLEEQAQRLRAFLNSALGTTSGVSEQLAQNAVAATHGFKDWGTLMQAVRAKPWLLESAETEHESYGDLSSPLFHSGRILTLHLGDACSNRCNAQLYVTLLLNAGFAVTTLDFGDGRHWAALAEMLRKKATDAGFPDGREGSPDSFVCLQMSGLAAEARSYALRALKRRLSAPYSVLVVDAFDSLVSRTPETVPALHELLKLVQSARGMSIVVSRDESAFVLGLAPLKDALVSMEHCGSQES